MGSFAVALFWATISLGRPSPPRRASRTWCWRSPGMRP